MRFVHCTVPAPLIAALLAAPLPSQSRTDGRPLSIADFTKWRLMEESALSMDGRWVGWRLTSRFNGGRRDDELHVKAVHSASEYTVIGGSGLVFSGDSKWAAYQIVPPLVERERLQRENRPVVRRVELRELATGATRVWDDAATFIFSPGSTHLLIHKRRLGAEGSEAIVAPLSGDPDVILRDVSWLSFSPSGRFLAYVVDAKGRAGNGVYVRDVATGATRALDSAPATYAGAAWSTRGDALAVLKGVTDPALAHRPNALLVFRNVAGSRVEPRAFDASSPGMPAGRIISELRSLEWSSADDLVFFGVKLQAPAAAPPATGPVRPSDVNVFHWNDERIQTLQARWAGAERNRTDRAAALLDEERISVLGDANTSELMVTRNGRWAVVVDERPYLSDWEEPRADYYRLDVRTGARRPMVQALAHTFGLAPDGSRFLYWKDGHVWAYRFDDERHANLTAGLRESLTDAEWDYPRTTPPSYGLAAWVKDGRGVVLNGRYDLWYVPFDGGAPRNLTRGQGAAAEMQFRIDRSGLGDGEVDLTSPVLLTATGRWTKRSGFYQLHGTELKELAYTDHLYFVRQRAAGNRALLYTRSSWSEFPDLLLTEDDFATSTRLTHANPHETEYAWGRRILIDYTVRGVRLQGSLAIPDGWRPGTRLPMVVTFYQKPSRWLHVHPTPRFIGGGIPMAAYASNGYLVLEPDVQFRGGTTYIDMQECVEAAVARVVQLGYADPARIGLFGHSFSGNGAAYIATRSNKFAAIVAGALTANPISEFNAIFPGFGMNLHGWYMRDQGRFGTTPWDDFDLYWKQSAIAGVRSMNTPLLTMQGENDENSALHFGQEFYNALRFHRKPVIFLSYPGEGHRLNRLENQIDFMQRVQDFFDHHLKGLPAAAWITNGERFLDKGKRRPPALSDP